MRDKGVMELYQKLSSRNGTDSYFRKFDDDKAFIIQYKGDSLIGQVLVKTSDLEKIVNAPTIAVGDGETKQTL